MSRLEEIDLAMMERCRELARRAALGGDAAIGSLVAVGERILAEAEEETPAGPVAFAHAELLAVQRALRATGRRRLPEATLYSTHEPCFLCSYAIRASRIGRLVLDQPVAEIGGATSAYPILTAADISIWGPSPEVLWTSDVPSADDEQEPTEARARPRRLRDGPRRREKNGKERRAVEPDGIFIE